MTNLADAEKTKLAAMTNTEKKAFFEVKMTEQKALRDAEEVVMDKLINEVALSDAEKVTLATIKTEHNAQKAEKVAREAKMTEMKPLLEKVKAGIAITPEEQAKLDAFKTSMPQGGKEGRGGKK